MTEKTTKTAQKAAYTGNIPNTPLRFVFYTAKPFLLLGIVAVLGVVIAQVAGGSQSYLISQFVDTLLTAGTKEEQLEIVFFWSWVFMVVFLIIYIGWRTAGYIGAMFIIRQNKYAANIAYENTSRHSHKYFSDNFSGSISNKISHVSDGSSEVLLSLMFDVTRHTSNIILAGFLFLFVDVYVTIGFFVVILITIYINYRLVQIRRPLVQKYSAATTKLRGQIIDVFSNIQATRQYARYDDEQKRVNILIADRASKDLRQWNFAQHINVVNNILALILTGGVLFFTYSLLESGDITPGKVVLVMMATFSSGYSMLSIGEVFNRLMRFYGEVEEGLEGLFVDHEIVDVPKAVLLNVEDTSITWNNVTYAYGANKVFDAFNLTIKPGERVGLVGPSGAGKTTFVSLLLRQHDIHGGSIEIDGQNIATVTQDSLREHIAVVPQEPMLFHRTIRENIAYGKPDATDEEIVEVAKKAQAHEFIIALEEGYSTMVGERGIKLSGGQKQRVAIARAMLKDAPILVLDEATSALDSESEVAIQEALQVLMEGKTVIAIAHRLSTLREMDRILVLEAGKIVEDGPHAELTKSGGTYQRLWEHQAGGFVGE